MAIVIASMGPILYPSFLGHVLNMYGVTGCILVVGGISSHVILAAILLHPLEWHLKNTIINAEQQYSHIDGIDEGIF